MSTGLNILIDWETIDQIMEANLLNTYQSITSGIKNLKAKKKLKDYEQKDLKQFETVLESLEVVGNWYIHDFDKKKRKKNK